MKALPKAQAYPASKIKVGAILFAVNSWKTLENKSGIPLGVPCVIVCRGKGWDARCLAFAVMDGAKVCWFGVTAAWHDPEELHSVVGYVPLADVADFFV